MAKYEAQVVHVRWWRGKPKRWTTRWPYYGTVSGAASGLDALRDAVSAICYAPSSSPNGYGGIAAIRLYNLTTGGVPVLVRTYFDWQVPSAWVGYTAGGWGSGRTAVPEGVGEGAMMLSYPAGLSKTGKPVAFRKFIHAIPGTDVSTGGAQIPPASVTSLTAAANAIPGVLAPIGLAFGDGVRLGGTAQIDTYFVAHQMVRGRRKKQLNKQQTDGLFQKAIGELISSTSSQDGLA